MIDLVLRKEKGPICSTYRNSALRESGIANDDEGMVVKRSKLVGEDRR